MDWANLTANVAQVAQLGGINHRLSGLNDIAAVQAMEAGRAADVMERTERKSKRIADYREIVLEAERALKGLQHHLPDKPLPVMALALGYRHAYAENGLTTAWFESYEDKDRLQRMFDGLDAVTEAAAAKLTPEQQSHAKLCLQYRLEENDLRHLVEVQKGREQWLLEQEKRAREAAPEIQELKKQIEGLTLKVKEAEAAPQPASKSFRVKAANWVSDGLALLAALSILAFLAACFLTFVGEMIFDLSPARLEAATGAILWCALPSVIFSAGAWLANSARKEERTMTVQDQLRDLQSRLIIYEGSASMLPPPPSDEDRELYRKFGGSPETNSHEYERTLAERQALVSSVLADNSQ